MCGGRGTRLDAPVEKTLFEIDGVPMVDRVLAALRGSDLDRVYAVTSPNAPETRRHVDPPVIETPGEGYVDDLQAALADDRIDRPVLTAAADLPLLSPAAVDDVLAAHEGGSLTVAVPAALKRDLGVGADTTFDHEGQEVAPAGVNVVGDGPDGILVTGDHRFAVNVNRRSDAETARRRG